MAIHFNVKHTLWVIYVFNIALVNRSVQNPLLLEFYSLPISSRLAVQGRALGVTDKTPSSALGSAKLETLSLFSTSLSRPKPRPQQETPYLPGGTHSLAWSHLYPITG